MILSLSFCDCQFTSFLHIIVIFYNSKKQIELLPLPRFCHPPRVSSYLISFMVFSIVEKIHEQISGKTMHVIRTILKNMSVSLILMTASHIFEFLSISMSSFFAFSNSGFNCSGFIFSY